MNILVIGNSGTGCLFRGYRSLDNKFGKDLSNIMFAGVGNPVLERWRLIDSTVYRVSDPTTSDSSPFSIQDFDLIIIAAGYCVCDPRLLYKEHISLHSEAVLEEIVRCGEDHLFQFSKHSQVIKSLLDDDQCSNNVILIGSPHPSAAVYEDFLNKVPAKNMAGSLRGFYSSLDSGSIECLAAIHRKNRAYVESICISLSISNPRVKYYILPRVLLDETLMFTKKEYMKPDKLHGNDNYGRFVMDDLLTTFLYG